MTISVSSSGGAWAGWLGPNGDERVLRRLLGERARTHVGPGFGLGEKGAASGVGFPDGGCSATVTEAASGPTLALSGDPFGLHGACHARIGETLWFASDPRLLRDLCGAPIDPIARHGYLCFSHVPAPQTIFGGVSRLPAGSRLVAGAAGEKIIDAACWREAPELEQLAEPMAARRLGELLEAAVCRRLGDERAVGVFLSGGLDSSLIAALLVRAGADVQLFTLDFGPPHDQELPCARAVARHLGRPLHIVSCRPKEVRAALEATVAALHEPFGDGVVVPLYLLGAAAAQQVPVVFNGEGGDQLFGGWANKPILAAEIYGATDYDRESAYLATYHRFHGLEDRLYIPEARAALGAIDAGAFIRPALNAEGFCGLLHRLRAANLRLKGAQNIAPRAVQLAAAHGLRVHAPFFDRTLADWTFTLPGEWFLRGACEKYLLKRAAEPLLPPEIVWREKRGMGVPVTEWCLRGPLRGELARRLSARRLRKDGWLDPAFVGALRRGGDVLPGEFRGRRLGEKLWCLLMLHVWQDANGGGPA